MIPSCTQEQKTDCHMNSHVTPIRNIWGMPFTQLSSDPKHIEITSSRHHLRAERKILDQNKKMLFDEGLESTCSDQFTSSTRLVQLNFPVISHRRSTTISFKTYTPDLLSVRVFLYQNTPRIWGTQLVYVDTLNSGLKGPGSSPDQSLDAYFRSLPRRSRGYVSMQLLQNLP